MFRRVLLSLLVVPLGLAAPLATVPVAPAVLAGAAARAAVAGPSADSAEATGSGSKAATAADRLVDSAKPRPASLVTLDVPAAAHAAPPARALSGTRMLRAAPDATPVADDPDAPFGAVVVEQMSDADTADYSLLGVTWREGFPSDALRVQVQTRADGTWSAWQDLDIDDDTAAAPADAADDASARAARAGTAPTWVDHADGVRVRIWSTTGTAPEDVKVALIDGGTGMSEPAEGSVQSVAFDGTTTDPAATDGTTTDPAATDGTVEPVPADGTDTVDPAVLPDTGTTVTTATTSGIPPRPAIVTRKQWGADASTEVPCDSPNTASTMRGVLLHHTVGANDYTRAESPGIVRGIHLYHTKSRGWCDIGYNFLVDKYGTIYEGRRGGINKQVRGAHAGNWDVNTYTTGISMMGNFDNVKPTTALKNSVVKFMAWRLASFGRNATSTMSFDGHKLPRISGHQDVYKAGIRPATATACPGKYAYQWLNNGLRSQVQKAIDAAAGPPPPSVSRTAAADRYATAAAIAQKKFTGPLDAVFLASGEDFPDALAGGPAAGSRAPLLLTRAGDLPSATADALQALRPSTVYVLGGEGAVSAAVANAAGRYATTVTRLSGANRYATMGAVVRKFWPGTTSTVYLASGEQFPDALSGAALAAHQGAPVALTAAAELKPATQHLLSRLAPSRVVLLGGNGALAPAVADQVRALLPSATVSRLSGADRYATSAAIAKAGWGSASTGYFVRGDDWPDALAGVPAAAVDGGPMLLAEQTCLPAPVYDAVKALGLPNRVLLGGSAVLADSAATTRCPS